MSFVTPSTSVATSSPNSSRTSISEAAVSSTVSCSSAAHRVEVSSRIPAQIFATPMGWTMKLSPDRRRWSAWRSQANTNACSTASRSMWPFSSCSSITANRSASRPCSDSLSWLTVDLVAVAAGAASTGRREKSTAAALSFELLATRRALAGVVLVVFRLGARLVAGFACALPSPAAGLPSAFAVFSAPAAARVLALDRRVPFPAPRWRPLTVFGTLGMASSLDRHAQAYAARAGAARR